MAKEKKKRKQSKYQLKLAHRTKLANKLGGEGFYNVSSGTNKGKRYPKPLSILNKLLASKQGQE